jgi:DNA-directed RNA polymerase subunit omega
MPEMTTPTRNNVIASIPDDPDQSTYRFIIVAAKRARQLQGGARPFLPTTSKKPTITAMEEVRRGLVKYEDQGPVTPPPIEEPAPPESV